MFSNKYLWRRYYSVCARNMMPRSMDGGTINCVSEIRQRSWMEVQWQGVTQQKVNIYFTSTDWGRRLPEYIPQTGKEVSPLLDRQGTTVIFCWNKRQEHIFLLFTSQQQLSFLIVLQVHCFVPLKHYPLQIVLYVLYFESQDLLNRSIS